jgi:response regulator RpfG family c-di-GMP phosphodiesterase
MSKKILCVDDDANILSAFSRQLRNQFELETALGGETGLEILASRGPFAVIVTDMRMPGMSGLDFLCRVRESAPLSVRIMLTGNSDQQTAIDAVNEGSIFRFLTKPCPPPTLVKALQAGVEQYGLVTSEKELLEETLRGSVKVLTEVLSLVNPVAFGRAVRVQRLVLKLAAELGEKDAWRLEVAAMLSQVGCVTVPEPVLSRVYNGGDVSESELHMFDRHPQIGHDLIAKIPRLEAVAEIVAYQERRYDGGGSPRDDKAGDAIPVGARILKCALDCDSLESRGHGKAETLATLKGRAGWYDQRVLAALERIAREETSYAKRSIVLNEMRPGMILGENLLNGHGVILVAKGQEITDTLLNRLQNISRHVKIREPVAVLTANQP